MYTGIGDCKEMNYKQTIITENVLFKIRFIKETIQLKEYNY